MMWPWRVRRNLLVKVMYRRRHAALWKDWQPQIMRRVMTAEKKTETTVRRHASEEELRPDARTNVQSVPVWGLGARLHSARQWQQPPTERGQ